VIIATAGPAMIHQKGALRPPGGLFLPRLMDQG